MAGDLDLITRFFLHSKNKTWKSEVLMLMSFRQFPAIHYFFPKNDVGETIVGAMQLYFPQNCEEKER